MAKSPKQRTLRNKCDKLWAQIIRSRGFCERCGKSGQLQAAHIFSRRYSKIRHDLENGIVLDAGCHFWAHANPIEFGLWVIEVKGAELIERLKVTMNKPGKMDYQEVYIRLLTLSKNEPITWASDRRPQGADSGRRGLEKENDGKS